MGTAIAARSVEALSSDRSGDADLGEARFRALLPDADWAALPVAVRRRFSRRLVGGNCAVYVGTVVETWMSRAGWLLARALRLIGGPLPTGCDAGASAVVSVTEGEGSGGQIWTRIYARRRGFPQVIHSTKRFCGPTGIEEHVGCGVGMTLSVAVEESALVFRSHRYFIALGGCRIVLPAWATPGALTVRHIEEMRGRFTFSLEIVHPRLGPLLRQRVSFREATPGVLPNAVP
jgi:Domain of unknown function (DUF4166)